LGPALSNGASRRKMSAGSFCPSPSMVTMMGKRAARIPVRSAALLPRLRPCTSARSAGSTLLSRLSSSSVPSLEPSSMKIASYVEGSRPAMTAAISPISGAMFSFSSLTATIRENGKAVFGIPPGFPGQCGRLIQGRLPQEQGRGHERIGNAERTDDGADPAPAAASAVPDLLRSLASGLLYPSSAGPRRKPLRPGEQADARNPQLRRHPIRRRAALQEARRDLLAPIRLDRRGLGRDRRHDAQPYLDLPHPLTDRRLRGRGALLLVRHGLPGGGGRVLRSAPLGAHLVAGGRGQDRQ